MYHDEMLGKREIFRETEYHAMRELIKSIENPQTTLEEIIQDAVYHFLTEKQYTYLRSYYFEQMLMKDIAAKYGVTIPTVSKTIDRAEARLAEALRYFYKAFKTEALYT